MIDTLWLTLDDFHITPDFKCEIQKGVVDSITGESVSDFPLWHNGRETKYGNRALWKAEKFAVPIRSFETDAQRTTVVQVHCSVPKVLNSTNLNPANQEETIAALKEIECQMFENGLKTNLFQAHLSRVDGCKRPVMDEAWRSYKRVMQLFPGQRMQRVEFGDSIRWGNSQQEQSFYDKKLEMQQRKMNVAGLPDNILSAEQRWMKSAKIRDFLGFKTAIELLHNWDHLEQRYRDAMGTQFFHFTSSEIQMMTVEGIAAEMRLFQSAGKRYWMREWLMAVAFRNGIHDFDAVNEAVNKVVESKQSRSQMKKFLLEAKVNAELLQVEADSKRTLGQLYSELKRKVMDKKAPPKITSTSTKSLAAFLN